MNSSRGWLLKTKLLLVVSILVTLALTTELTWAKTGKPSQTAAEKSQKQEKDKEPIKAQTPSSVVEIEEETEGLNSSLSIITRTLDAGPIVFFVLFMLIIMSILTWAIVVAKWVYLRRSVIRSEAFIQSFWESRSLNELNTRLSDHPYSPLREHFRTGYAELVRASQLKETTQLEIAVNAAMDNLYRALQKSRIQEKRHLEKYLSFLAISASASPFIGLFGTVWGIMTAFEGIARSGNASLTTVAPGISEALIATAFGLAAAIPAVIGYNIANNLIRSLMAHMEGFGADFLNIVERYLVSDRSKTQNSPSEAVTSSPRI